VLSLLESMDVQGRSGLDILIQTWCENAETFQGFWPGRISNMALTQLFVSERLSLQTLMVKGDIIVKPETQDGEDLLSSNIFILVLKLSSVIMTRSRTKTGTLRNFTNCSFLKSYTLF
jgi:importin-9